MKLIYIFARYFGLQNKLSTGAKKEKWTQLQDDRYIYGFEIQHNRKW